MNDTELKLRKAVVEAARAMNALGINRGTSGNVSARLGEHFLMTPSGVAYAEMTPEMVVRMDLDGGYWGELLPSTEWRMHAHIYRGRQDAGGVVHTHSTFATALSCLRIDIPAFHYMIAKAGGDTLRCATYATFATEDLSVEMMTALEGRSACLLANHGQIALGGSVDKALKLAVEVEELAEQYWIATRMGTPVILDAAEMARVREKFASYGKQDVKPGGAVSGITRRG